MRVYVYLKAGVYRAGLSNTSVSRLIPMTEFLWLTVWGGSRFFSQKFEEGPHLWALIF